MHKDKSATPNTIAANELKVFQTDYEESIRRNLNVISTALTERPVGGTLTADEVEILASHGIAKQAICSLFKRNKMLIDQTPELLDAFNKGRASIGARVRTSIIDDALNNGSLPAKIHLDKIFGGDIETKRVEHSIAKNPADEVPVDVLLDIEWDNDEDT